MAANKAQNLREKTNQELQDQLILEKKRLFDGVVKSASGEAIKAHEKREGRKLIARIKTILSERARRAELKKNLAKFEGEAKGASLKAQAAARKVEQRLGAIKAELAKPAGERKVKPFPKRVAKLDGETTLADRRAIKAAEAKRLLASIDRMDVGEAK